MNAATHFFFDAFFRLAIRFALSAATLLFRYVVEQVFRFNARKGSDASKRLTYKVLTGQNDAGFMGIA